MISELCKIYVIQDRCCTNEGTSHDTRHHEHQCVINSWCNKRKLTDQTFVRSKLFTRNSPTNITIIAFQFRMMQNQNHLVRSFLTHTHMQISFKQSQNGMISSLFGIVNPNLESLFLLFSKSDLLHNNKSEN